MSKKISKTREEWKKELLKEKERYHNLSLNLLNRSYNREQLEFINASKSIVDEKLNAIKNKNPFALCLAFRKERTLPKVDLKTNNNYGD